MMDLSLSMSASFKQIQFIKFLILFRYEDITRFRIHVRAEDWSFTERNN